MNRHVRWYRRLVHWYPRGFRERFGDEMVVLFADQVRDAQATGGRAAIALLWVRSIVDLLVTVPGQHLARRREAVRQPVESAVVAAAVRDPGPPGRFVTILAASPFVLWVGLQVVAPGFTDPLYSNPPGILGLPAGLVAVGFALVLAGVGLLLVRRSRSGLASLAVIAFITLPAWMLIVLGPPLVLIVQSLDI